MEPEEDEFDDEDPDLQQIRDPFVKKKAKQLEH
jgi:hypothetical protein